MEKQMEEKKHYAANRWGVLNHVGEIWTPETFDRKDQAQEYIDSYQRRTGVDLSRHRPVRVDVRVTLADVANPTREDKG